jgi:hypothetical protein
LIQLASRAILFYKSVSVQTGKRRAALINICIFSVKLQAMSATSTLEGFASQLATKCFAAREVLDRKELDSLDQVWKLSFPSLRTGRVYNVEISKCTAVTKTVKSRYRYPIILAGLWDPTCDPPIFGRSQVDCLRRHVPNEILKCISGATRRNETLVVSSLEAPSSSEMFLSSRNISWPHLVCLSLPLVAFKLPAPTYSPTSGEVLSNSQFTSTLWPPLKWRTKNAQRQ